jgi:hypothetical protein
MIWLEITLTQSGGEKIPIKQNTVEDRVSVG